MKLFNKIILEKPTLSLRRFLNFQFPISNFQFLIVIGLIVITSTIFFLIKKPSEVEATWWNDSWNYRKAITINGSKIAGNLENFPMLVSLTDADLGTHAQADADDIIFISANGEKLSHEIESFATTTGALVAWVKMPTMTQGVDANIFMYYGNAGVGSQETAESVWDENFVGVWHFPNDATASGSDSTAFGNNGVAGYNASSTPNGKLGGAFSFDGDNDYVKVNKSASLNRLQNFTVCTWVKPITTPNEYPAIVSKLDSVTNAGWDLYLEQTGGFGSSYSSSSSYTFRVNSAPVIATNIWHYLCATQNGIGGNNIILYRNGIASSTGYQDGAGRADDSANDLYFGTFVDLIYEFHGLIDETKISRSVRSATWIATEYNNQNDPTTFLSAQTEETGPGPVGYWSFDEGYGTVANDSSANNNNGTITGAVWKEESECVAGKCLWFDGNDYAGVSSYANLLLSNGTYCAWVKTGSDQSQTLLSFSDGSSSAFDLQIGNGASSFLTDEVIHLWIYDGGNQDIGFTDTDRSLFNNAWHHVCLTADEEYGIYIDGISKPISVGAGSNNGKFTNDTDYTSMRVGYAADNYEGVIGYLDEVKIYPYARTADQIKQDYAAGLAGQSTPKGATAAFGSASDKWMTDGLVGYWKFDESATTSGAIDASGNGNTGTYYGDASTTAGKYGNGGSFNGTDDGIYAGSDSSLDNLTNKTICAWLKPDSLGDQYIIGKDQGTGMIGWNLYYQSGIAFYQQFDVSYLIATMNYDFATGIWHYICVTYDGKTNLENLKFWANGLEVSYVVYDFPSGDISDDSSHNLMIGMVEDTNYEFNGKMDEIRIYNRILSANEIRKLYEWAPGPVAHWKFDEATGATAYDSVASSSFAGGNHGSISGATWAQGKYGGALDFDGVDDYVNIGEPNDLMISGGMTVTAWIKHGEALTSNQYVIGKMGGSGQRAWGLSVEGEASPDEYAFTIAADGTNIRQSYAYANPEEWTFVVGIFEPSSYLRFYLNGIMTYEDTVGIPGTQYWNNGLDINIGNRGALDLPFDGLIDDVRIYNYARTQKQILEDMNAGNLAVKSPVLHLSFDEGYGAVAHDASIFGNDGLLQPGTGGANTASSAMWTKDGKLGGAMEFDGVDDGVKTISNLDITGKIATVSFWMKHQPISSYTPEIFLTYSWTPDASENGFFIDISDNSSGYDPPSLGSICTIMISSSDNYSAYCTNNRYDDNQWHNVIAVMDRNQDTAEAQTIIYIDGDLVNKTVLGIYDYVHTNTYDNDPVYLGYLNDSYSDGSLNGLMDEVKIWNFALNEDEIKAEYNLGKAAVLGSDASRDNNGTAVTGANKEYCIPGDTAVCTPPVLEMKFDELSGGTVFDTSGNGNNGAITGATWDFVGKKGGALDFDGGDYVYSTNQSIGEGSALTVNVWVNFDNLTVNDEIFVNRLRSGFYGWSLYREMVSSGGSIVFLVTNSSNTENGVESDDSFVEKGWHYITGVYDGSYIRLYSDGKSIATPVAFTGNLKDTTHQLCIGGEWNGSSCQNSYNGSLDDVKIYNYARTPAQIAWDYNGGKPVAHWKFDECAGGVVHDDSGNGNHGQLFLGATGVTATGTCASSSNSFWYNGRVGKNNSGGSFDGGSDYALINSFDLSSTPTISLSFWVKKSSFDNIEGLFELTTDTSSFNNGFAVYVDSGIGGCPAGTIGAYTRGNVGDNANCWATPRIDVWHHFVYIGDKNANGINENQLYIDGILQTPSSRIVNADNTNNFGDEPLYFGSRAGSMSFLTGLIDDVKIWNYALTEEQVKMEYGGGAVRFQ